jgi:AcrR family transcriptional regulator
VPRRTADHMTAQRERILRATIACISELGIERTSVAEIRARAGLSAGALYTHFASKEEIVAAALRFGGADDDGALPDSWPALRRWITETGDEAGLDFATLARTQLQVIASSVRPGPLQDQLRPAIARSLAALAAHLETMESRGAVRLRLSPVQTAMAIAALKDGLAWIALAQDRPLPTFADDLRAALDCLIEEI